MSMCVSVSNIRFPQGIKRVYNILLVLFLILILSSCIEVKQKIELNTDGSGTAAMEVAAQPMYGKEILHDIKRNAPKGWAVIQETEKDGKNVVVFGRKFQNVSELSDDYIKYECLRGTKFLILETYSLRILHLKNSEFPFPFEILVKMPGGIDESNGIKVSSREVRWNMQRFSKGTAFSLEASSLSLFFLIIGVIVLFLVGGAIFYAVSSRAKGRRILSLQRKGTSQVDIFCSQCGTRNAPDAAFCVQCGTKTEKWR